MDTDAAQWTGDKFEQTSHSSLLTQSASIFQILFRGFSLIFSMIRFNLNAKIFFFSSLQSYWNLVIFIHLLYILKTEIQEIMKKFRLSKEYVLPAIPRVASLCTNALSRSRAAWPFITSNGVHWHIFLLCPSELTLPLCSWHFNCFRWLQLNYVGLSNSTYNISASFNLYMLWDSVRIPPPKEAGSLFCYLLTAGEQGHGWKHTWPTLEGHGEGFSMVVPSHTVHFFPHLLSLT